MEKKELLKNEQVERLLSPHPLSFMKLQTLCIFMIVWGVVVWWLVSFSQYKNVFAGPWYPFILWALVLMLVGVIASLMAIQWSIFFLYLGVVLGGLGILFWQPSLDLKLFILVYSIVVSIAGFLIVEVYRRSHKYYITNLRIMFKGGVLTKRERTIRYDKITDINSRQGILGQIFGFGTIIPISESGFGLGSDKSMAGGGVEVGKKTRLFGFAGGGKEVQTPIARSYYELHGVYPFREVQKLVENMVQSHVPTQYQKEQVEFSKQQVDIQKQMRDLLHQQVREKPRTKSVKQKPVEDEQEEEEPDKEEEAFPQEQVDIQKQMQQLLKKQRVMKPARDKAEEEAEEEEEEEKSRNSNR